MAKHDKAKVSSGTRFSLGAEALVTVALSAAVPATKALVMVALSLTRGWYPGMLTAFAHEYLTGVFI